MAWSYSGDPASSDLDQVRFLIQDTVQSDQLLSNEEITFLIADEGSTIKAAVKAAETLGALFARKCDEKVGQVSIQFSQKSKQYFELAKSLRRRAAIKGAEPFAGAMEITQKETQEDDTNRVQPSFRKKLHDHDDHEHDDECYDARS